MHSWCYAQIHYIEGRSCRFSPIWFWQMFLIHHCPCHLEYMPVLSFGYSVLLRCMFTNKLPLDSFLPKVCCEGIREVLFVVVWSKAPYMTTNFLFDFVLEFLEVWEHFTLLPHGEDPGVPREVFDERYIILTTTDFFLWVGPHASECITSRISLLTFLSFGNSCWCCLPNWQASHMPGISFSIKVRSSMTIPFDCIPLSFWRLIGQCFCATTLCRRWLDGPWQTLPISSCGNWGWTSYILFDRER